MTDRRTDGQTDRRTGKNNMSPDPVGGRHNKTKIQLKKFDFYNQQQSVDSTGKFS